MRHKLKKLEKDSEKDSHKVKEINEEKKPFEYKEPKGVTKKVKSFKNKALDAADDLIDDKASGIDKAREKVRRMTKINTEKKVVVPEYNSPKKSSKIDDEEEATAEQEAKDSEKAVRESESKEGLISDKISKI